MSCHPGRLPEFCPLLYARTEMWRRGQITWPVWCAGAWALSLTASAVPLVHAQPAGSNAEEDPRARAAAIAKNATKLYQTGNYREAKEELKKAIRLDPQSVRLMENLAVVHEKLVELDEAIGAFRRVLTLEATREERERAEIAIRRLEGAKRELLLRKPLSSASTGLGSSQPPPPSRGRLDVWTYTAGGIGLAALGVGIFFSVKALNTAPPSGYVTGRDGTYEQLRARADNANRYAMYADIGYGIALAGATSAILLYALRTQPVSVSVSPTQTGGLVSVTGALPW